MRRIVITTPKPTPAQLRALVDLSEPTMWDHWKGRFKRPRSAWHREDVMWRCVGQKFVERASDFKESRHWQLTEAGRAALRETLK